MKKGIVITIDGPAGVGKSSVGKDFAQSIGYKFISTGKMYRALAYKAFQNKIFVEDENTLLELAKNTKWEFISNSSVEPILHLDGIALDKQLNDENIARLTSSVARLPRIREFMVMKQREIGREGSLVMEGRDIGTNVFPDSPLKFYLDASPQARAERRVKQLISQGIKANYDEILSLIIERDEQDSRRKYNPLKKADDAHYIDTTNMTQSEVVKKMLSLFKENIS